jgi:hypothetical protein
MDKNLLKLHKCTIKGETKRKRVHLEKKKKARGKVGPIDAHGGCVTKKGSNQTRNESKSPMCVYTHTAYVGWWTGPPPRSHLIVQCT